MVLEEFLAEIKARELNAARRTRAYTAPAPTERVKSVKPVAQIRVDGIRLVEAAHDKMHATGGLA